MATYKIRKGSMRSGWRLSPLLFTQSCTVRFRFDASAWYDPSGFDQINKLAGISDGFHHHNSVRLGWMAEPGGVIRLYQYDYYNGHRLYQPLYAVVPGIWYEHTLTLPERPEWGYKLFPYFGGTKAAPHDMVIHLEWMMPQ